MLSDFAEGCRSDYQCAPEAACVRRRCENVCQQPGVCGINAQCLPDNHRPICSCNPGYVGDAKTECRIGEFNIAISYVWSFSHFQNLILLL